MLTHITEQVNECELRERLSFDFIHTKIGTYMWDFAFIPPVYNTIFKVQIKKKLRRKKNERQATKQPSIVCVLIYDAFLSK